MSFYAIDSYDRRNDHSWYKTAAASAVTASALNKPFAVELTSTTSMAPSAGDGKVIGMSAIAVGPNASQTMIARYSENSTEQNPIITVSLGDYGSYNISVKDVDPKEATQIEIPQVKENGKLAEKMLMMVKGTLKEYRGWRG